MNPHLPIKRQPTQQELLNAKLQLYSLDEVYGILEDIVRKNAQVAHEALDCAVEVAVEKEQGRCAQRLFDRLQAGEVVGSHNSLVDLQGLLKEA